MTSEQVLALLRSELGDSENAPYFWSDADLYAYINDAQKMFCRLTDGIGDATTAAVTQIAITLNAEFLALHASILKIRSAYLTSTGEPLTVINQEEMPALGLRFDGRTGPVKILITGIEENKVRVYPKASATDTIQLSVFRLPVDEITGTGQAIVIPVQHHRHLTMWCKHLAYAKNDADTYNETLSQKFEGEFRSYCELAAREQRNKRHKVRTVAYGGI